MKKGIWRGMALCLAIVPLLFAREAAAFFPLGGFLETGQLVYMRWPLSQLDTNRDGDVRAGEGLPLVFESGVVGFTDAEIQAVLSGCNTWAAVPTAFMAFRYEGKTPDPLELELGLDEGSVDFINYVAFEFSDDLEETVPVDDVTVLPEGTLSLTLMSFALTDTTVTVDGQVWPVSGGQMIDVDMVFNGDAFRRNTETYEAFMPYASLRGIAVTASGFALGLNLSPLVNGSGLILDDEDNIIGFREDRVAFLPSPEGPPVRVGTTPSMVGDVLFVYTDGGQSREDLAPDDIAGVSFLYPRGDQSNFFSISHEARTRARRGFPSGKIEGGYVVAWCDADNNPETPRVPFMDTLTGLYQFQELQRGRFTLYNLFKQLPNQGGVLFEPTYVLSVEPFDPITGADPSDYDSTRGGAFEDFGDGLEFSALFSSEVFREGGNVLGVGNVEQGTPLYFDPARNRVLSADTGRSIPQMLPGDRPMFGDPVGQCPLLQIVEGGDTGGGTTALLLPKVLRGFRDSTLLKSAVGVALVDVYYEVAPVLTGFLRSHPWALSVWRALGAVAEWLIVHPYVILLILLGTIAASWKRARRVRLGRTAVVAGLIVLAALASMPAQAQLLPMSTEQLVELTEEIVAGTIERVDSQFSETNRIETKVTVVLDDVLKGGLGREGQVEFTVIGGRVGDIVTYSPQLPTFKVGEEVVLFLKRHTGAAAQKSAAPYRVAAGIRGKKLIKTDPETGEKYVSKSTLPGQPPMIFDDRSDTLKKRMEAEEGAEGSAETQKEDRLPLADYKAELRGIVAQQKAAQAK